MLITRDFLSSTEEYAYPIHCLTAIQIIKLNEYLIR